ncbi:MAG: CIA30 family protein, partial [Candidatus Goldbacteria bacterium]|nr:CIA30 family protein [Candidatus Goldiibacteriota bacterium]
MRIFKLIMSFLLLIYLSQSVIFGALSLTDWVDYPYGVQYANGNLNATVNDLNNKYNLWKQNYVTSSGAGGFQRVYRPESSNDTVSEGIGYGMLLAVYFNDKTLFDNLWSYKQLKNDGRGLMHWQIDQNGNVIGSGSASDGDFDIAFALLKAQERWGGTYGTTANSEINKIATQDINASDYHVKPGDAWDDYEFPSYFAIAFFRQFGTATGTTTFWNNVISKCNSNLSAARNPNNGLVDETITHSGARRYDNYKYNSCRVPWRYANDYVWNGDSFSQGQINLMAGFFNGKGAANIVDCYNVGDGSNCSSIHNAAFVGPAACSMMVSSTYQNALNNNFYPETNNFPISSTYYNASLQMLTLILMAGYMPAHIGSSDTPTPTPTGGTGGAGLLDDMEDNDPQNNWGGYWYTFDDLGSTGSSYVVPWTEARFTAAGLTPEPFYMQSPGRTGSGYAARMTGYVTTAFQYGFVGMGTTFLEPKGPVDLSSCTGVKFWYKGDGKSYRMKIPSASSSFLDGEGDNHYGYAFIAGTSWTQMDLLMSSLTQEPYWGSSVARADAMSKATDIQFQTVGQPQTSIELWVDEIEFYGCSSYPTSIITPAATNTFTNTNTPGGPTETWTPTQIANAGLLDDMEDGDNANNWGGYWYTYDDLGSNGSSYVVPWTEERFTAAGLTPEPFYMQSPGRTGSGYAARMTGYVTTAFQYGFVGMGTTFLEPKGPVDLSSCTGVKFWYKGDGKTYRMKIPSASSSFLDGEGDNHYGYAFIAGTGWTQMDLLMSSLTQEPYWGSSVAIADAMSKATDIQFQTVGQPQTSIELWVDEIEFYGCSSYPTPAGTATDTPAGPTNTWTNTPTWTETPVGPTYTWTNTPEANPGLVDDMEDGDNQNNW